MGTQLTLTGAGAGPGGTQRVLLSDSFTDADATPLASHTPEIGGPWVQLGGAYQISSNTAQQTSTTYDNALAVCECGKSNITGSVTVTYAADSTPLTGFILRCTDVNNFFLAGMGVGGAEISIWKLVAGVFTKIANAFAPSTPGVPDLIQVSCSGNTITLSRGLATCTATDAFNHTATRHGLWSNIQGSYFQNILIEG